MCRPRLFFLSEEDIHENVCRCCPQCLDTSRGKNPHCSASIIQKEKIKRKNNSNTHTSSYLQLHHVLSMRFFPTVPTPRAHLNASFSSRPRSSRRTLCSDSTATLAASSVWPSLRSTNSILRSQSRPLSPTDFLTATPPLIAATDTPLNDVYTPSLFPIPTTNSNTMPPSGSLCGPLAISNHMNIDFCGIFTHSIAKECRMTRIILPSACTSQ